MELHNIEYVSPSGKKFEFVYENLSKETDLKTAAFTFPEKDGAYIQSLGRGGRRFPMTCIFTGEDCAEKADKFEAALEERGVGVLTHPVYGKRNVVPTGTIKRNDGLVSEANQSIVETTFSETLADADVLSGSVAGNADVDAAADAFKEAAVLDCKGAIDRCSICGKTHERSLG